MARLTEGQPTQTQTDGPSLKLVLGGVAIVSIIVGVLAYYRYSTSERWVAEGIQHMDEVGEGLDVDACIEEAVSWHDECDQQQTNAAVCLQGVKVVLFHCLDAADRSQTCELYLDPESELRAATEEMRARARNPEKAAGSGKWVYGRCEERGMRCVNKRECACAEAYRAVDSFCRTGQQAVQL